MSLTARRIDRPAIETLSEDETFFDLLRRLHQDEYTGLIILHWAQGEPKKVEFPGTQVRLRRTDRAGADHAGSDR